MSTQNHTLKWLPPPLPACSRAVFSTVSMSTNVTSGHPYRFDMYATRFINKKTKHRRMQSHPAITWVTPQSLGPTPHHEATNTAITGSDTTPWGNKHHNHWARHHTMRSQTLQSLGQTPHHEAKNAAITGSDTTPWSHKCRDHWVRHHTMRQQTPQSLRPTPHHEATNTAITGSDTTPWSHKCRDHWVRHHTMKPQTQINKKRPQCPLRKAARKPVSLIYICS
jgi:hypothetical protein